MQVLLLSMPDSFEHTPTLAVRMPNGGLASLANYSVTVDSDGDFSICVDLQPGETGTAEAMVSDWWGIDSALATYVVL